MKTIVFQSFRTERVPEWISRCLESARRWAETKGFAYRFWDDAFFDFVPASLRPRASTHVCLLTDYARIVAARDLLAEGWDRAIWVDADAVVFNPEKFEIPITSGHAFCREIWHDFTLWGRPLFKLNVNNSVSVFCRDQTFIDPYLNAVGKILGGDAPLSAVSIGTEWLLAERRHKPFPLLATVGVLGPEMMYRYLHDDDRFLRPFLRFQTSPLYALNLCHSKNGQTYRFAGGKVPWTLDDHALCHVIDRLVSDQGSSLNAHFEPSYQPPADEFSRPLSRLQDGLRKAQLLAATRLPALYRLRRRAYPALAH